MVIFAVNYRSSAISRQGCQLTLKKANCHELQYAIRISVAHVCGLLILASSLFGIFRLDSLKIQFHCAFLCVCEQNWSNYCLRAQRNKHTKNETFDQARVKLVVNFPFEQQKKCIIHRYSTTFLKYDRLKNLYWHKSYKIFAFAFNIIRFVRFGFVFITNGGPSLPFLSHS